MKVGSLFTGIGGFDLGFEQAGCQIAWQVEVDPYAQEVLKWRFRKSELHGDVRDVGQPNLSPVDILVGGSPCQNLSRAGDRTGLEGSESALFFEYVRLIRELRPRWFVFENVPGMLESNRGRDFAIALRLLEECGYGLAWRILNAQFFGVAQRRRRVFIVGHLGSVRAVKILFNGEGGAGDRPSSDHPAEPAASYPPDAVSFWNGRQIT